MKLLQWVFCVIDFKEIKYYLNFISHVRLKNLSVKAMFSLSACNCVYISEKK